jgi:hypothetical protein
MVPRTSGYPHDHRSNPSSQESSASDGVTHDICQSPLDGRASTKTIAAIGRRRRWLSIRAVTTPGHCSMPPSSSLTAITGQIELARDLRDSARERRHAVARLPLDAPPPWAAGNRQRSDQACRCALRSGGPADASACPFHLSRPNECLTDFFVAHRKPPTRTQPTPLAIAKACPSCLVDTVIRSRRGASSIRPVGGRLAASPALPRLRESPVRLLPAHSARMSRSSWNFGWRRALVDSYIVIVVVGLLVVGLRRRMRSCSIAIARLARPR